MKAQSENVFRGHPFRERLREFHDLYDLLIFVVSAVAEGRGVEYQLFPGKSGIVRFKAGARVFAKAGLEESVGARKPQNVNPVFGHSEASRIDALCCGGADDKMRDITAAAGFEVFQFAGVHVLAELFYRAGAVPELREDALPAQFEEGEGQKSIVAENETAPGESVCGSRDKARG